MKYMLLIYQGAALPGSGEWDALSPEEQQEVFAAYKALNETPGVTPGLRMREPEAATTVRVEDGETLLTDGPFAETKEVVGGYCFVESDSLDEVLAIAARIPAARMGGAIEVRQIVE